MALVVTAVPVATGTGTATTGSFSPPDGSLLLVGFSGNSTGGSNPSAPTITDNLGVHLTYTRQDWHSRADSPAVNGQSAIWTAPIVTGAAMTVSVTNAAGSNECAAFVWYITGQDSLPVGAHGNSSTTSANAITQTYTAQATSGQGFIVSCDWDLKGTETAGTGCTMEASGGVGGQFNYGFARRTLDDDSNGVSNTLNVNLPGTSTNLSWCYIEILPLVVNQTLVDPPPFVVIYPPGRFAPNGRLTPWFGASDVTPGLPPPLTVTATEGGATNNGIHLTVKVLTGTAITQNGAFNSATGINPAQLAITPNATGSIIYGALLNDASTSQFAANAQSTIIDSVGDATNTASYASYRSTSTTTAATPVTTGSSTSVVGQLAQVEIVKLNTIAEDASSPVSVTATNATTVTTAVIRPPNGALLVAIVSADGGVGVETATVSGGGYVWTELVKQNASSAGYVGIWITRVYGFESQSVSAFGIVTSEVLGLPTVALGATSQDTFPIGISSNEIIGTIVTTLNISPIGISTNETIGTIVTTLTVSPIGIQSAEILGTPTTSNIITPVGVPGTEQFGIPAISLNINAFSINSAELLGFGSTTYVVSPTAITTSEIVSQPVTSIVTTLSPVGIQGTEQFGVQSISLNISPTGLGTSEYLGVPLITLNVNPTGISTSEALGYLTVANVVTLAPFGIATQETFGVQSISFNLLPVGISGKEQFGNLVATLTLLPVGIQTSESLGTPSVSNVTTIAPVGILGAEQFGQQVISLTLAPNQISTSESLGNPTTTPGVVTVTAVGSWSQETLGTPSISLVTTISSYGIQTQEKFGLHTASLNVTPTSIQTTELIGNIAVVPGAVSVAPVGIPTQEILGFVSVSIVTTISPIGIQSQERVGFHALSLIVLPVGILSTEQYGNVSISVSAVVISPVGIVGQEQFGIVSITLGLNVLPFSIKGSEVFGVPNVYRRAHVNAVVGAMLNVDIARANVNVDTSGKIA